MREGSVGGDLCSGKNKRKKSKRNNLKHGRGSE